MLSRSSSSGPAAGDLARAFFTPPGATDAGHHDVAGAAGPDGWNVRVHDAIAATERTVAQIKMFCEDYMGLDPGGGYNADMVEAVRRQRAGKSRL